MIMEWEYVTDPETGLKILKSEKDPKALDRVQQMANKLFRTKRGRVIMEKSIERTIKKNQEVFDKLAKG